MKREMLLPFFILAGYASRPQDTIKHLSLQQAITASVANSHAIRLSELDVKLAQTKYRQTDAVLLPQVNFSYTAITSNNPLNTFGSKLQQQSISAEDFNIQMLNNPSATPDFSGKIEFQQPILNVDMFHQRKSAAIQVEMHRLLSKRTKEYLSFETEKAYLQLQLAYNEKALLNEALTTGKALYKISGDYYDQGLIQKSDLLNAQLHVINFEAQVNNAQSRIRDASDVISMLMGQPPGVVYTIDTISINNDVMFVNASISGNRPDFKALEKGMESYDRMIRASQMSRLPRLNAFASYQVNDRRAFGLNAGAYFTGIQLSWNIFNGNRTKNAIAQQRLEKEKLAEQLDQQKSEAQLHINHNKRQMSDALFDMKQQKAAVEHASEALRVLRNRYTQGLAKTTDLLMAQTEVSKQRMAYVRAVYNYNVAVASLQYFTTGE